MHTRGKGAHELQHHAHAMTNNMNNVSSISVQLVAEYHTGKKSAVTEKCSHHAHAMTNNMNNVSSISVQLVAEYHTGKKSAVTEKCSEKCSEPIR